MVRRAREELRAACARRRWREGDARVVVDALDASGESVAVFAREHGLVPIRVHRWRQRMRGGSSRAAVEMRGGGTATLIPVTVSTSLYAPALVLACGDGVRVEVHDVAATPPGWIAELMRALREADA